MIIMVAYVPKLEHKQSKPCKPKNHSRRFLKFPTPRHEWKMCTDMVASTIGTSFIYWMRVHHSEPKLLQHDFGRQTFGGLWQKDRAHRKILAALRREQGLKHRTVASARFMKFGSARLWDSTTLPDLAVKKHGFTRMCSPRHGESRRNQILFALSAGAT